MANGGFSPDWLGELKTRNDIVTTVSHYIQLQRKGKNHWGCCPFHFEKTPSFSVNEVDQYFHCFGCGVSGDVISFVQKYENIDFIDAIRLLAKNAGMEVPTVEEDAEIKKKRAEKEQILHALRESAIFYRQMLLSQKGAPAREYLNKRGVTQKSITSFGLGYSPDFNSIVRHLTGKGYSLETLKNAGIIETNNGRPYDFYGGRLMFPLISAQGEVVGFSGRLIEQKDFAKYKNSPQTMVFDKSRTIFGINLIKNLRNELRGDLPNIILVEGQLDVVSMHQAGFNNTVACLGTALTRLHCLELQRFTNNIILMLDGDGAGQKATLRSLDVLAQNSELSVKVARLPENLDPDEFLKKYGVEKMKELLNSAVESMDYQISTLSEDFDLDSREQRAKFIKEALKKIETLKEKSSQEIYLKVVSQLAGVPADRLREDMQMLQNEAETQDIKQPEETEKVTGDAFVKADKFILASLLHRKPYAKIEECENLEFLDNDIITLFNYIKQGTVDKPALVSGVYDRIDVKNNPMVEQIINFPLSQDEQKNELMWQDCLRNNELRKLEREKEKIEKYIKQADLTQGRNELIKQLIEIDKKIHALKNKKSAMV